MKNDVGKVDWLFEVATEATDKGDFKKALDNLGEILEFIDEAYGDNNELSEMKTKLAEVYSLLEETK